MSNVRPEPSRDRDQATSRSALAITIPTWVEDRREPVAGGSAGVSTPLPVGQGWGPHSIRTDGSGVTSRPRDGIGVDLMRRSIVAVLLVATATLIGGCASEAGGDITGKTWHLTSITTVAPNFATVVPAEAMANYTISFDTGGTFAAKADCNQVSGTY